MRRATACVLMLCLACVLGLLTSPASAQDFDLPENPLEDPDQWLAESRWKELRYGLTIRQPHNAKRDLDTKQGDAVRWAMPDGTRIRLSFARGVYETVNRYGQVVRLPPKVSSLKKQFADELKALVTGQVVNTRTDQVVEVGDLVGIINYFVVKPTKAGTKPFLNGVALLQLDDLSVVVIRMECLPDQIVPAICTFECMVNSIQTQSIKDVNARINGWITNSEKLLATITQQDKLAAMRSDSLYRVIEANKDIGYLRVWQRHQDKAFYKALKAKDKAKGGTGRLDGVYSFEQPGNAVIIQSHYRGNDAQIDTLFEAVDAVGKRSSYWQIKTSMGFEKNKLSPMAGTWVETGVRGVVTLDGKVTDHLMITREGTPPRNMVDYLLKRERDPERRLRYPSADKRALPKGNKIEKPILVPRRAYLSIVDAELMPALLPREAKTYAFGAYDPDVFKLDIRTMRVEPTDDGGKIVYMRPTIDKAPQAMKFDRNNDLVSCAFPDGREVRRTTRQELARVWNVRLKE